MRKFGAGLALGVLLVASACGSGSSRPSADEISQALRKGGEGSILGSDASKVSKTAADCVAKILEDSRISDRALRAIVEHKKSYQPSTADTAAATSVSSKIVKCIPAGLN